MIQMQPADRPQEPYPLLFEPILVEKPWGGRRLESLGKQLAPDRLVGESWELADLDATTAGFSGSSTIRNGPYATRPIGRVVEAWGDRLLGGVALTEWGGFPALIKYLDATQHLSVQVHPDADYALVNDGVHLKSECWYIIEAEPEASLYLGLREGVSAQDLVSAARGNSVGGSSVGGSSVGAGSVVDLLNAHEAVPGTWFNVPSGTVHALGAGVLVAEVQTASDTTFRLYDWTEEYGRSERTLHLDEAAQCISTEPAPMPITLDPGAKDGLVVETPFFSVAEFRMEARETLEPSAGDVGCRILMATSGSVEVRTKADPVTMELGDTCLIPADCLEDLEVEANDDTVLISVRFNQALS